MKAPIWVSLIAAVAFGASTIYLSVQLKRGARAGRTMSPETRALNARIAELEKARSDPRFASGIATAPGSARAQAPTADGHPPDRSNRHRSKPERGLRHEPDAVTQQPMRGEAFRK